MILFFGICLESAPKLGRLLSREEVATTWIGLSEDELYMFRITLEKSGGGVVAYGFLDENPVVLNVRSWSYDPQANPHIVIRLSPEPSGIVQLTGDVIGTRLELQVAKADWKRRVFLRQESTLFQRWERLRMAMKASTL